MVFYTTVTDTVKRGALFRGTSIAAIGILIIAFSGAFLSPKQLDVWGLPILLSGIFLIARGLIPYRKLCRLETAPNKITLSEEGLTLFEGKKVHRVPLSEIERLEYTEKKGLYGICLYAKGGTLFLPYFSRRVLESLLSHLP